MRRLGKIKISDSFFKDEFIMDLTSIFSKFIPVHIEHRFHYRDYVYTGYCKDFEELEDMTEIPYYVCVVKKEDDKIEVSFKEGN